jgi:cytochrome P450
VVDRVSAGAGAPLVVDLADPALWQDPYPTWRAAREAHRTAVTRGGEPILLAADDFDAVHLDPAFGQPGVAALDRLGIRDGPFRAWRARTMAATDGEPHERLRAVVARAFTPRRVERMRAGVRAHAESLFAAARARGGCDVVADYAFDLPLRLVCEFIGLPQEERPTIGEFLVGTEEGFADPMTPERRRRAEDSIVALSGFVTDLIRRREADPRDDLVSDLVESHRVGRVDRDELVALVVNVIGGAIGSSRAAIANGVHLLLAHPDQTRWIRDDPARLRPAVEECLRFRPPFRTGRRKVLVDGEHFGLELRAGSTVLLARQAANRDPARWDHPDRFDVARAERRHHSFGYGPHFCVGQALARLDVQEALAVFVEHGEDVRLVDDDPLRIPFTADEQLARLEVEVAVSRTPGRTSPGTPPCRRP